MSPEGEPEGNPANFARGEVKEVSCMAVRIKRNYHHLSPAQFYSLNHRVRRSLAGSSFIPEQLWTSYCTQSDAYENAHLKASYKSVVDIAERDLLQASLIAILDEMASALEGAAVRKPELLLTCGFDLTKEHRKSSRSKTSSSTSDDVSVVKAE
jgi:hypothetical protein